MTTDHPRMVRSSGLATGMFMGMRMIVHTSVTGLSIVGQIAMSIVWNWVAAAAANDAGLMRALLVDAMCRAEPGIDA